MLKQLLWRKNKRRGFLEKGTLQRLWQINQNMNCFANRIKSHATEKFEMRNR